MQALRLVVVLALSSLVLAGPFWRHKPSKPTRGQVNSDPLFLTPYLQEGRPDLAREYSEVKGVGTTISHSGYLTTNSTYGSNMFFWFFPSQTDPKAPVLLWLQGGPGGSSLFGLFVENGPYNVLSDGITIVPNPNTWNTAYSMLYIDNPVGTGYSFTGQDAGYATNEDMVAADLYSALTQFFLIFDDHQPCDFYVTGESYAGKYIPAISYKIHIENAKPSPKPFINLKGLAIGDGWTDPINMVGGYSNLLYDFGLCSTPQKDVINTWTDNILAAINAKQWVQAFDLWDQLLNGDTIPYPSYFYNITGLTDYYNMENTNPPAAFDYYSTYVTLNTTRDAIHVGSLPYNDGSVVEHHLEGDFMPSMAPLMPTLIDNYKVLVYSGQLDIIVASSLTAAWLDALQWSGAADFAKANKVIWKVKSTDTDVAGYARQSHSLSHVIVRGAGHILPYDQPVRGLDMITRFIENIPFTP